jgi:uncharacterized membrane protein HdeD (DUF308 family)
MKPVRALARRLASQPDLAMVLVLIVLVPTVIIWPIDLDVFAGRVLAWIVVFGAIAQFAYACRLPGLARITGKAVAASLYLVAGVWSLKHPAAGFSAVSLLLLATFSVSAVVGILTEFYVQKRPDSTGMLLDGLVTMALAIMVWQRRPAGFLWVIATLLGLCMLMGGVTGLMVMAVRKRAEGGGDLPYEDRRAGQEVPQVEGHSRSLPVRRSEHH